MSMIDAHFVLHYPLKDFFEYRYLGKTALFFNLLWIAVGIATIYGVYQKIRKFLYPLAILFTLDLFLLILRDIVVIWINHPWAHVNLLWPYSAVQIIYASLHVMTTLVALGKLFDQETSAQSGPNFVRFKVGPEPERGVRYSIGIASILGTFFMTLSIYSYSDFHFPLEEFYDYRFMGSSALVFGVAWLTASIALLYGIYKEKQPYLYPFVAMFMFDLFLMVARDIAVFWLNLPMHNLILLNVAVLPVVLLTSIHVMFSMIVLGKMFLHEPKVTSNQAELVVFNEEIQQAPLTQVEAVGDDVALVED
ncbi:hypothetical protein pipiens_015213 [Culex pipiens pipiens]|uniref:Transmembrane protein n=1 Tax=Culex pipiens pipiens TaxID=38569 RepID=A0ABD1CRH0_CULPP